MTQDFYCDEVLNGKTQVNKVIENDIVLAYHHTRPNYQDIKQNWDQRFKSV